MDSERDFGTAREVEDRATGAPLRGEPHWADFSMTPQTNDRVTRSRELLAMWISAVPQKCWSDKAFDGLVYGSGYSAWGLWAQINLAFVLASSLSWPPESQDAIPATLRDPEQRRRLLAGLLRYVVGCHTTGSFDTVGGGRWGARLQAPHEREHFENWHSPIWVTTLAQIVTRAPCLDQELRDAVWGIVAHDSAVQASLPLDYLDGRADSDERHGYFASIGGANSHPESNAWKGSLVSLARMMPSGTGRDGPTGDVEKTLWLSSSACPSDARSDKSWIDGHDLLRYQVGTHLSDSGAVIHHGVLHPCYSVFALFSRLQTHEFARYFGRPYPPECERREGLMLSTLLAFIVGGRMIYPSGQDWPRWIYGQCYLAPVLAHQQRKSGTDMSEYVNPAIDVLLREAEERPPRLLGRRFEHLEINHRWHYDRYEADLAYALALTAEIAESTPSLSSGTRPSRDAEFFDRSAQTALVRVNDTAITVSTRTLKAPFQILIVNPTSIGSLEWNGCGSYHIRMPDLPDLAGDTSMLESYVPSQGRGFRASIRTVLGLSPQTDGLLELRTIVRALPEQQAVAILHRLTVLRHATVSELHLHCWGFAHGQSGSETLSFTDEGRRCDVAPGRVAEYDFLGHRLRLQGGPTLVAPAAMPFRWRIRHDAAMSDPLRAFRWTEVYLPIPVDASVRWRPGQVICEVPIVATFSRVLEDITFENGTLHAFWEDVDL